MADWRRRSRPIGSLHSTRQSGSTLRPGDLITACCRRCQPGENIWRPDDKTLFQKKIFLQMCHKFLLFRPRRFCLNQIWSLCAISGSLNAQLWPLNAILHDVETWMLQELHYSQQLASTHFISPNHARSCFSLCSERSSTNLVHVNDKVRQTFGQNPPNLAYFSLS